ncbi:MAG: hypothetical protein WAU85_03370 [Candidatus Absconditicoccaceae bacterium]
MQETLKGGGAYYISKREIEKMKKNMKKVPIIQKRSELYHKNQNNEAESFINNELEKTNIEESTLITQNKINKKLDKQWRRSKLIYSINNLFFKIFNGN